MTGIYKITNMVNGKVYIGQSVDVEVRWRSHKSELRGNYHENPYLQNSWNKYGEDNFKFEIIESCNQEDLNKLEIYYIKEYNSYIRAENSNGYNMTEGGDKPPLGNIRVICEGVIFESIKKCAEYYNIPITTITSWLNGNSKMPKKFFDMGLRYLDKENNIEIASLNYVGVWCDNILYKNITILSEITGISDSTLQAWVSKTTPMPKEWYDRGLHRDGIALNTYEIQQPKQGLNGGKNPSSKRIKFKNEIYECVTDFATKYNLNPKTVMAWLNGSRGMPEEWYNQGLDYVDLPSKRKLSKRKRRDLI